MQPSENPDCLKGLNSNIPRSVLLHLRDRFALRNFVETGAYLGTTTFIASKFFQKVTAIEIDPSRYRRAAALLKPAEHVSVVLGNSAEWMARTDWSQEPPTFFFLDAHKDGTSREENPLFKELAAIGGLHGKHCVFVDDWPFYYIEDSVSSWQAASFNSPIFGEYQWCALTPARIDWERLDLEPRRDW